MAGKGLRLSPDNKEIGEIPIVALRPDLSHPIEAHLHTHPVPIWIILGSMGQPAAIAAAILDADRSFLRKDLPSRKIKSLMILIVLRHCEETIEDHWLALFPGKLRFKIFWLHLGLNYTTSGFNLPSGGLLRWL